MVFWRTVSTRWTARQVWKAGGGEAQVRPVLTSRIFILEGIATVLLSGLILVFLPYDPRRCTFLTDNERDAILANRLAEGDGGHAHFKWKYLKQTMTGELPLVSPLTPDYKVWMCTFLSSAINMVTFGCVVLFVSPNVQLQLYPTDDSGAARVQGRNCPAHDRADVRIHISRILTIATPRHACAFLSLGSFRTDTRCVLQ